MNEFEILVCGSVTAKQYEPLRIECIRNGFKPFISRDYYGMSEYEIAADLCGVSESMMREEYGRDHALSCIAERFSGWPVMVVADEKYHVSSPWNIHGILQEAGVKHEYWVIRPDGKAEFC